MNRTNDKDRNRYEQHPGAGLPGMLNDKKSNGYFFVLVLCNSKYFNRFDKLIKNL
jgi:hypothetical protein